MEGQRVRRTSLSGAVDEDRSVVKEAVVLGTSIPLPERKRLSWTNTSSASPLLSPMTTPLNKVGVSSALSIPSIAETRNRTSFTSATGGGVSTTGGGTTMNRRLSFEVPPTPESAYYGGGMPGSKYGFGTLMMQAIQSVSEEPVSEMTIAPSTCAPTPLQPGSQKVNVVNGGTAPGGYPAVAPGTFLPTMCPFPQMQMPPGYPYMMPMPGMQFPAQAQTMPTAIPSRPPGTMVAHAPPYNSNQQHYTSAPSDGTKIELGSLLPSSGASGGITTLMLRNIPLKYNRESLLAEIDSRGFINAYDFFYLPIDFHTGNNMGYAFINLIDENIAKRFRATYNGVQLSADSAKICQVGEAKAQGKMKNVEQYRNSSVMSMDDRYQPVVFENGVRQPFPSPTRSLKPVKPRARVTS